jgi:hypothetical protein
MEAERKALLDVVAMTPRTAVDALIRKTDPQAKGEALTGVLGRDVFAFYRTIADDISCGSARK